MTIVAARPARSVIAWIREAVRLLLATLILLSVLLNVGSVVARYVFLAPIFWAEQVIIYMMMWCVFTGAALVTWDDRHLSVDIVSTVLPRRVQIVLKIAAGLFLIMLAALVIPQSWEASVLMIRNDQRTAVAELPLAIPHGALLVGFTLILLAALARVVVLLRHRSRDDPFIEHSPTTSNPSDAGTRP
jgi:TRAP-type C4-dicarboxylate transport system permease small subunit